MTPDPLSKDSGSPLHGDSRTPVDGVHTIPVPQGWTPEQAWEAITRGDVLAGPQSSWANVVVRDGRFVELVRPVSPWPPEDDEDLPPQRGHDYKPEDFG